MASTIPCRLWSEPEGFMLQNIVRKTVQSDLRWAHYISTWRLVSRYWYTGVSHAVELLIPRPFVCVSKLIRIPGTFPNLQVLQIQRPTVDCPAFDEVIGGIGQSLCALRSLRILACYQICPSSLEETLRKLESLRSLELYVPGDATLYALSAVRDITSLTHLSVHPIIGGGRCVLNQVPDGCCAYVLHLTSLRSLACSAQYASSADLSALSALTQLSSLALAGVPESSLPGIAELAGVGLSCTLRHLDLSLDFGYSPHDHDDVDDIYAPLHPKPAISAVLPLSCLSRLSALSVPWEVLALPQGTQLSGLRSLTSLAIDFHYGIDLQDDDGLMDRSTCCWNTLSWLRGLSHLRLANGGIEVSQASLIPLADLAPALTSLDLDRMHVVDDFIMEIVANLTSLRKLRIASSCFGVDGVRELPHLNQLTFLELSQSAGIWNAQHLVEPLSQATSLRHLRLRAQPYLDPPTLDQILSSLTPFSLQLLQVGGGAKCPDEAEAAVQSRWAHVLQYVPGDEDSPATRGWAMLDAHQELRRVGVLD